MNRKEAVEEYAKALKEGQKEYKEATASGKRQHPLVLDELLQDNLAESVVDVGLVEIPTERIIGTNERMLLVIDQISSELSKLKTNEIDEKGAKIAEEIEELARTAKYYQSKL